MNRPLYDAYRFYHLVHGRRLFLLEQTAVMGLEASRGGGNNIITDILFRTVFCNR